MGNRIPNMVARRGGLGRMLIGKRKAESFKDRRNRVILHARMSGWQWVAVRYHDTGWEIYDPNNQHEPRLTGLTKAQAEMWLRHRSTAHG